MTSEFFSYLRSLDVKLWIEADRLRYSAPSGVMTSELLKQLAARKQEIVRRHEVLRTRFTMLDGQPIQDIQANLQLQIPVIDLREISEAEREDKVQRLATEEARQLFDLGTGPLLRLKVLKLGEDEHVL